MLVLSRKERQRVRLGDSIVLTIVRVSGDKVRLGIEAPENLLILRDELEKHDLSLNGVAVEDDPSVGSTVVEVNAAVEMN